MSITLKLTQKQLDNFVNGKMPKRFIEVFDDIPMYHPEHVREEGETHRDYVEDDGRQFRWFIFKDTKTNIEYCLNYTFNSDWPNDVMDTPDSIKLVIKEEDSDLFESSKTIVKPEPTLTPEQQADKALWAQYEAVEGKKTIEENKVPTKVVKDLCAFLKAGNFNLYQLRAKIIPVCIEYKVDEKSLWTHVQQKRGAWKK